MALPFDETLNTADGQTIHITRPAQADPVEVRVNNPGGSAPVARLTEDERREFLNLLTWATS